VQSFSLVTLPHRGGTRPSHTSRPFATTFITTSKLQRHTFTHVCEDGQPISFKVRTIHPCQSLRALMASSIAQSSTRSRGEGKEDCQWKDIQSTSIDGWISCNAYMPNDTRGTRFLKSEAKAFHDCICPNGLLLLPEFLVSPCVYDHGGFQSVDFTRIIHPIPLELSFCFLHSPAPAPYHQRLRVNGTNRPILPWSHMTDGK